MDLSFLSLTDSPQSCP